MIRGLSNDILGLPDENLDNLLELRSRRRGKGLIDEKQESIHKSNIRTWLV